jgi:hypothetical protein
MIAHLEVKLGYVAGNTFDAAWCHVRCLAHVTNLVCQVILNGLKALDRKKIDRFLEDDTNFCSSAINVLALDKVSIMIRKFRRSPQQFEKFSQACVLKGLQALMPVIDVSTRWNSTYDMLVRACQYRDAFRLHALNEGWNSLMLSDQEWQTIKFLIDILGPFKDATMLASKSVGITLNNYVSIYAFLLKKLKASSDMCRDSSPDLVQAIEDAIIKLKSYYDKSCVVDNLSSVLDPR